MVATTPRHVRQHIDAIILLFWPILYPFFTENDHTTLTLHSLSGLNAYIASQAHLTTSFLLVARNRKNLHPF